MNRKQFIESFGATCKNWTWSWSFVNHDEKFVIFGAWDNHTEQRRALILGEDWTHRASDGAKSIGFPQSREHIRLIESAGYRLFTFPMYVSNELKDAEGYGPSKIDHFDPELTEKTLRKEDSGWYAYEYTPDFQSPEELQDSEKYIEGACKSVTVNAYERNRDARAACLKAHGTACVVCGFDFSSKYGPEVSGFIHVHHLVPVSARREQYELDPIKDLRPVCPNCHAVIHYGDKLRTVEEVKESIRPNHVMQTRHWSTDPFWAEALETYEALRKSGRNSITLDLDTIEANIFNGGSPAYLLMEAMSSVREHEGWDGHKGAPRLVLALLANLNCLHEKPTGGSS